MTDEWTEYNLSAGAMYRYLDREAIEYRRARNCDKFFRKLGKSPLRKFAQALKYAMVHDSTCHEFNIREKVTSSRKIGVVSYYLNLKKLKK